jgi:hypothetical protein
MEVKLPTQIENKATVSTIESSHKHSHHVIENILISNTSQKFSKELANVRSRMTSKTY